MKLPHNGKKVTGFVFDGHLRMETLPLGMQNPVVQIARARKILILFLKVCIYGIMDHCKSWLIKRRKNSSIKNVPECTPVPTTRRSHLRAFGTPLTMTLFLNCHLYNLLSGPKQILAIYLIMEGRHESKYLFTYLIW
jgi:hypothetical protein